MDLPIWKNGKPTSFISIMVCTSLTSQYCGSQWMCAVQTSSGWWICDGSGRIPRRKATHQRWWCKVRSRRRSQMSTFSQQQHTVAPSGLFGFEQGRQTDIILGHDAIQHVIRSFRVGQCQLVELDQVIVHQREPEVRVATHAKNI